MKFLFKKIKAMYEEKSLSAYRKPNQNKIPKSTSRENSSIQNYLISNKNKSLYKTLLLLVYTGITSAASLGSGSLFNPTQAQVIRNYTPRYRVETKGQTIMFGNSVTTCSTTIGPQKNICNNARQGLTSGSTDAVNNVFYMDYIDIDSDSNTFNSSSADYNFPAGSTILWAGLYWTGDTSGGGTGNGNPAGTSAVDASKKNQMLLKLPSDITYKSITAANIDISGSTRYSSFADVTNLVKQSGSGTYFGANIQTGKGEDRFGGWTLIVVYEDPTQTLRSMTIFDGFAAVSSSTPITTYINGFLSPPSGNFDTTMGVVSYEGDVGFTGDQFLLDGDGTGTNKNFVAVGDSLNPTNNFFNSSNTFLGTRVSAKNPDYPNLLAMDMDIINAVDSSGNSIMQNGTTSAGLRFTSSGDVYYPTAFTFGVQVFQPVLTNNFTKKVIDVNGGDVNPGDELEYEIAYTNKGNDAAKDVVIQDSIPLNTTFVSGSLEIVADPEASNLGLKTDATGDDEAEFNSATNKVIFRSGTGANATQGGEVDADKAVTLRFRVKVNSGISSFPTTISNQASIDYKGKLTNTPFNGVSDDSSTSTSNDATKIDVVQPLVIISGRLYEDSDRGDDFDSGEPTLPAAIKVILYKDTNTNNTIDSGEEVANTLTNGQGQYTFNNVTNGTYKVKVDTSDSDIPNGLTLGTPNDLTVTVSSAAINNINFGFDRAQVSFDPDPPNPETDPNPPAGICASPGSDGTSTLSGVVNTYYPGTQSASAGATQITLGTATGLNSPIKKGDKLLIIQMQDAEINSINTDAYGNGNPGGAGSGSTTFNTSGYYEYVVANNTVAATGGNLQITTPLAYTFTNADATSARGQRRFQVIRLPQYRNATVSGTVTAAAWNGRSGGIVAVDVADTLTFSGAGKIDVSGQGFRGGGGRNTIGTGGTPQSLPGNTDYVSMSTNPYHGSKGEGIAGTPKYIRNDVTTTVTVNPDEGYPNGSFGRGAPGNAGGGSTDPNIENNSANTGGGGGANRGFGGKGGDSWTDGYGRQPVGGFGGQAFLTTVNRIIMGGGGGAGTANNSATGNVPSGGGGGGIVLVRAGKITGTGTIEANGIQGIEPSGTDGGGGGGAGGTVLIQSVTPSTSVLTVNARGGKGLDSGYHEHGPGGGGGGGYVAFQGVTPVSDVGAGQPGNDKAGGTVNSAPDPYGATAGDNGLVEQKTIPAAGVKPGAECSNPNVLLVKRITSINNYTQNQGGDNLAAYKDQETNPYDDNNITITNPNPPVEPADTDKWPDPNTFLIGGINGGKVNPNDEMEYTIYYLSAGNTTANNVLICDRVPENATFIPTAFNNFATKNADGLQGADRGVIWQYNGATESLSNVSDGDAMEYLAPGINPVIKYPGIKCDGTNTNGVVIVNLGNLPNATAPGTPVKSYGFIRFRGRVK